MIIFNNKFINIFFIWIYVINDYFKEVKKEEYKEINKEDNIFPRKMPPPKKFMPPKKMFRNF